MKYKYLFLICIVVLSSCTGSKKDENSHLSTDIVNNPITASETTGEVKQPVITFSETAFNFGKIVAGEKVNYSFKFKNTGEADLIITSASATCGCTVPEYPKEPISPGEEGIIKVEFNSEGKSGMQNKTVTIVSNTNPNSHELLISGEVITK